jgi:hypothetical protein
MLCTRAVICAILKMDQNIAETTTVLLAGLILSDWFESQMPCWCLHNCKGKILLCDNLFCCIPVNMMKPCREHGLLPISWPPHSMHVTQMHEALVIPMNTAHKVLSTRKHQQTLSFKNRTCLYLWKSLWMFKNQIQANATEHLPT